jgi:RNA polymerase sigma-70 factor (ECF subfamily)
MRARNGDEAGFLELWRALQPRLLRYLRVLGCANPGYRAGETWLEVVTKLHEFSGGEEDFRRWLFAIGRQRAIQSTPASPQGHRRAAWRVAGSGVEGQVLQTLSARHASALLSRLSPDQAEAVALRALAGPRSGIYRTSEQRWPCSGRMRIRFRSQRGRAAPLRRPLAMSPAR